MFSFNIITLFCYFIFGFATIIRVPQDYPTIISAIAAASAGDTVLVSPGVYHGNVDFLGKNIVVGSLFMTTGSVGYIANTVIRVDSGSVVTLKNKETSSAVLCGFTLTGGTGNKVHGEEYGGGIYISGASPIIRSNNIMRNSAGNATCAGRGGGVAIKDSSNPLIIQNTILNNSAAGPCRWINYFGGGIWIDSTSNPIIGGSLENANNISTNFADVGLLLYRAGEGAIINAQYNYFGVCPPGSSEVFPFGQFEISNCLEQPVGIEINDKSFVLMKKFRLFQNYPNPFNPSTTIRFELPEESFVILKVYNVLGQEVATLMNGKKEAGEHEIGWTAEGLQSGLYFYKLIADKYASDKKAIWIDKKKMINIK